MADGAWTAIETIKSAAVFVGENGIGPWQNQEIQALLSQFVKRRCPIIPAILPSAKATPALALDAGESSLGGFPQEQIWIRLSKLIWGITGEKPRDHLTFHPQPIAPAIREADINKLLPRLRIRQ